MPKKLEKRLIVNRVHCGLLLLVTSENKQAVRHDINMAMPLAVRGGGGVGWGRRGLPIGA